LAVAGLTAVGVAAYKLYKEKKKVNEVSLDLADSMTKQMENLQKNIEAFDALQAKNKLTNDELARFADINSELAKTSNHETIAKLKEEQAKLLEKSGLTNEEMNRFLKLNEEIAKQVPETNAQITEQGNILIKNTEAAKKVNAEQRERIRLEYELQMATAENNRVKLLQQEDGVIKEINKTYEKRKEIQEEIREA